MVKLSDSFIVVKARRPRLVLGWVVGVRQGNTGRCEPASVCQCGLEAL
jgi:hypothetical protein